MVSGLTNVRPTLKLPLTEYLLPAKQDAQKSPTPLGEVEKRFPPRGSLCLHRLVNRANFVCSRCSLEKTSKLVAYANDKSDEPLCNGCYGNIQSQKE